MSPEKVNFSALESEYQDQNSLSSKKIRLVDRKIPIGGNFLDIGTGTGALITMRLGKHDRIYGTDYDETSVNICKKIFDNCPDVTLIRAGIEDLPGILDTTFDCITCLDVLEHIDEKLMPSVLGIIYQSLNDEGVFVFSGPGVFEKVRIFLGRSPTHLHSHSSYGWMKWLKRSGFSVLSVESVEFPFVDFEFLRKHIHLFGKCCVIAAKKNATFT
jgi:2-polyprenyl-3-methyl-5-hydroxy-6-metoxy-1,4-benzoquinol methylase